MEDNSIDSCVTDPPYGLSFMGKHWDYDVPSIEIWNEVFRVLKPGGYLLSFSGTRTYHRMVVAIEDAGFEIRDQIMWVYGSGFPKSHNISKAVDARITLGSSHSTAIKKATENRPGKGREVGTLPNNGIVSHNRKGGYTNDNSTTEEAKEWEGWGTALKPAHEPICVARKPFSEKTVAENVLKWGTGAINIDGCRIETNSEVDDPRLGGKGKWKTDKAAKKVYDGGYSGEEIESSPLGRWPANFIHDGSDEVVNIAGSAARFFYTAKTSKSERNEGAENNHPTVKPVSLMTYLCRLVTPSKGIVIDPFMGSGSTGKAAIKEGFNFVGIEREKEYFDIAKARIEYENKNTLEAHFA